MKIEKEVITKILTTDGFPIKEGATVVFITKDGKGMCGSFSGITSKGALEFKLVTESESATFRVMPNSIKAIYLAELSICSTNELPFGEE